MAPRAKLKTIDEKFSKLEEIVDDLENNEIDMDKALSLYKEGVELVVELNAKLSAVSQEVLILKEKADGSFSLAEFEAGKEEDSYE